MTRIQTCLALAVAACLFAVVPAAPGQTASFTFDDMNGPADQGIYPAGAHFTLSINLAFAAGGNVANLAGLTYFFEQQSPLAPFNFSITDRDGTGSSFTSLQTTGLTYPQALTPSNANDLGAGTESGAGLGGGNYFIANVKFSIDPSTAPGTYIIENTTSNPKKSVISDDHGHTFAIPKTTYTITVVPFIITSITYVADQYALLQCKGVPNAVNRVEASPDLSPNSFQTIGSVTPDASGIFSYKDMAPGAQREFYRIAYP